MPSWDEKFTPPSAAREMERSGIGESRPEYQTLFGVLSIQRESFIRTLQLSGEQVLQPNFHFVLFQLRSVEEL